MSKTLRKPHYACENGSCFESAMYPADMLGVFDGELWCENCWDYDNPTQREGEANIDWGDLGIFLPPDSVDLRHRIDQLERDNEVLIRKLKNSIDDCRALWKQVNEESAKVTRFEVIDRTYGVTMSRRGGSVELSYQDEGRTLKVFLKEGE
jgi:hypothetical protein